MNYPFPSGSPMDDQLKKWIRPEFLDEPGYAVTLPDNDIKLNQNESSWDWPDTIKDEVAGRISNFAWNRYPQGVNGPLREKLADSLAVKPEQIILGNGSNEILAAITTLTLTRGDTLCTLAPTFAVYDMLALWHGAHVDKSELDHEFRTSEKDLLKRSQRAKLTILCNPNSPTGSLIDLGLIEQIASAATGLVVVDEAYVQYSNVTAVPLVNRHPNLVVTRTFSKAYALAGFRLGYGVMSAALAEQLRKCLLPFNIDTPSAIAASILLDHQDWVEDRTNEIIAERDQLIRNLNTMPGVIALPSHANFFLLQTRLGSAQTFKSLLDAGILVRDVSSYPGCREYVRITIGAKSENARLVKAIEAIS